MITSGMDNFQIDLTAQNETTLRDALRIAFRHNAPGGKATHWIERPLEAKVAGTTERIADRRKRRVLILLWNDAKTADGSAERLPVPLDSDGAFELAWRWLAFAEYGDEPDHDGSNGKGFRIFCDYWGHVQGYTYGIVGITPEWAMYGK